MEYYINTISKITGVSTRTLRYYHEINLLLPKRINTSNYRIYGDEELKKLQIILFYRELDFPLEEIQKIVNNKDFDIISSLEKHLELLIIKKNKLENLIKIVQKTILSENGEIAMNNEEKFEIFKKSKIEENEKKYGDEIRAKYSNKTIDKCNDKFQGLSKSDFDIASKYEEDMIELMLKAMSIDDPYCDFSMQACELHKKWLNIYWHDGLYTKEIHKNLVYMYLTDERFKAYYEKNGDWFTEFFYNAILHYCK
ncbi:MAG: MerR family transcriptional regulator [Lachnospirales bacterium]